MQRHSGTIKWVHYELERDDKKDYDGSLDKGINK